MGLVFLLVLLGVGCFYLAYREQKPFQEIKVKGEALQKLVVQETVSQEADPMERTIDFAALQRINPEIVGWLYVPQIGVDSPILTGQTDTEYLTKDFEGAYSPLGSIFTFAGARLSDSQVYLFAHNMAFGQSGVSVCPQHGFRTDVREPETIHERCVSGSKSASLSVYTGACPETAGGRLDVSAGG